MNDWPVDYRTEMSCVTPVSTTKHAVCHPYRGNAEQMCMCVKKQPSQSSQAHMRILDLHEHVCLYTRHGSLKMGGPLLCWLNWLQISMSAELACVCVCVCEALRSLGVLSEHMWERAKEGEKECRGPNRTQRNITPGWRPRITAVESQLSEGHFPETTSVNVTTVELCSEIIRNRSSNLNF